MCRLILYQQDSLPDSVSQYNKLRDSLYVLEGVPIYGRRVIVPRALRQKVILPINAQLKWWTQSSGLESQQTWRTTETVVVFVFHQLSVQLCTHHQGRSSRQKSTSRMFIVSLTKCRSSTPRKTRKSLAANATCIMACQKDLGVGAFH